MVTHKRKPFFLFQRDRTYATSFLRTVQGSRRYRRRVDVTSVWTQCAATEWGGQVDVSPSSYSGSEVEISAPKAVTQNEVCTGVLIRLAQVRPRLLSNSLFTNPHDTSRPYTVADAYGAVV